MMDKNDGLWALAAAAVVLAALSLVAADVWRWHPGFAIGDESDVMSFLQRYREGMPWRWMIFNGSLHKTILQACMALWPGQLWASSIPNMVGLALEAALLFAVVRPIGGARAAFFAVFVGAFSAFTLLRARVGLSYGLFPAEWLALVWLRGKAARPWASLAWGAALALCLFDYEGWSSSAILLLALPIGAPLDARRRAWELGGCLLALMAMLSWGPLVEYAMRRQTASLWAPGLAVSWRDGLGLFFGGRSLPYLAPSGVGVCAPWLLALAVLGLQGWGAKAWPWAAVIAMGLVLPLMGGAPYGLPAHRFIVAWPALALGAGMGIDRLFGLRPAKWVALVVALALAFGVGQQLKAWQASQGQMDVRYRAPTRDLQRAARAAWSQHERAQVPLVTELHPVKGSLLRYLTGHIVPTPSMGARQAVAIVPSDYAPALKPYKVAGEFSQTFQEWAGSAACSVVYLDGRAASDVISIERALRPLFAGRQQGTLENALAARRWLQLETSAGAWARTIALDSASMAAWYNLRFDRTDFDALTNEPLVSARPLLMVAPTMVERDPLSALGLLRRARGIDPANARARQLEIGALQRLGRLEEAQALGAEAATLEQRGQLIWE